MTLTSRKGRVHCTSHSTVKLIVGRRLLSCMKNCSKLAPSSHAKIMSSTYLYHMEGGLGMVGSSSDSK